MAHTGSSALRVGALMIAGLAILGFAIFSIGAGTRLLVSSETLEVHFKRINGLQSGAQVMLSGVRIGSVDSVSFPADPSAAYVVVRISVEKPAASRVRTDSLAQISTMGLLGDKYVELTPGSSGSAPAPPGSVLPSRDPIDYQTLLQREGTNDMVANVIAISKSMRSLLEAVDKGHGILSEIVRGPAEPEAGKQLTLASIRETLDNLNQLSSEMSRVLHHLRSERSLAGAMLSEKTNGMEFLKKLSDTAESVETTSTRLNHLVERFDKAQGIVPRLLEDKQYARQILDNLRQSSTDLREILHKINTSRGTVGLMVNDPALYHQIKDLLDGGGWALGIWRVFHSLAHPFGGGQPASPEAVPVTPVMLGREGTPQDPARSAGAAPGKPEGPGVLPEPAAQGVPAGAAVHNDPDSR